VKINLLKYTEKPETMVAVAARLCYSPVGVSELLDELGEKKVNKLVRFVIKSGHLSTTEHICFTFAIEGVSRALTHQLVRHRVASYNQQSQRYVSFKDKFEYIIPPEIERDSDIKDEYNNLIKNTHKLYKKFLDKGIEPEDARYLLPNASETKIIVTMNGRELLHFFTVRCCNRAQWEIRKMAIDMLKQVKKVAPIVFEKAGPNCLRGPCPEGKFKCENPPKADDFKA